MSDLPHRARGLGEAADHDLLPEPALGLYPAAMPPRLVGPVAALGDDPFKAALACSGEELRAAPDDVRRVSQQRRFRQRREQTLEAFLPFVQRQARHVLTVLMPEIDPGIACYRDFLCGRKGRGGSVLIREDVA